MRPGVVWALTALTALALALVALFAFGPREPVETGLHPDYAAIAADPEGWLAARDAAHDDIRPRDGSAILWAGERGARTPLAVLYLHGFSASPAELRPVPELVAEALGANLVHYRLSGHGRDGAALAEPRAGDWIADMRAALAVARAVGEKVLVIGTSTGGTLAALAALEPGLSDAIAGIVFVSPNFGVQDKAARLALLPFARLWAPLVAGRERRWEPANAEQAAHWTTRYPTLAGIPLMALVDHAARQDYARARMPALFVYSERDQVIRPDKVKEVAGRWGGPVRLVELTPPGGAGGSYHVITGDIVSPETTPVMVETILDWWRSDVAP